jgi:hypothetical protein
MKQLFRKYDTNKDRRLDHAELRGVLTRAFGQRAHCRLRWICKDICNRPYCAGLLTEVADDGTEATMEDTTFVLRMADKKTTVRHH